MKLRRLFFFSVCSVCSVGHLSAQPTPTPTATALTVNKTTGAITAPVIPSLFASGNSLLTTTAAAAAYQPLDADLTAIAALTTASYGRSLLTLADAAALRTSAALVIGTDVQAYNAELAAISGLSSNGLIARTSSSTAAARTLTGTAGQITVVNGDGVSGNPTLSLPTALTSVNSVTSPSASNLTLATLDSNQNILLTPHGSGFVIARSLLSSQRDLVPTSSLVGQVAAVGFTNTNKATVMGYDTTNNFGFLYAGIVGSNYSPLVLQPMAASGNVLIGGTTDISGSGGLKVFGTTASTSTTTGALIVSGGAGFAGNIHAGGTGNFSGAITATGTGTIGGVFYGAGQTNNISIGTSGSNQPFIQAYNNAFNAGQTLGLNTSAGGAVSIGNSATITTVNGTTASTSTTTGSLVNAGGFGCAGAAWFGGQINSASSGLLFSRTGASTALQYLDIANTGGRVQFGVETSTGGNFFGGATAYATVLASATSAPVQIAVNAIHAATFSSTAVSIPLTTASTSTTTGSLVNAGGFGNAGAAYFGQQVTAARPFMSTGAITANMTSAGGIGFAGGGANVYSFGANAATTGAFSVQLVSSDASLNITPFSLAAGTGAATFLNSVRSTSATGGIGYATGAGGAVTQGTSRTTGVTLNTVSGAITLFTAAGSATWQSFTVTNSAVAATDTIIVNQRSGTDLYMVHVTAVGAGSFRISFATTGGTTSEAPVINFSVIKAVSS
jgi:hypothetical protein